MDALLSVPFVLAAVISLTGVFYEEFDDNLLQRCGMATVCVGSTAASWLAIVHGTAHCNAGTLIAFGVTLYGLGTALKIKRYR